MVNQMSLDSWRPDPGVDRTTTGRRHPATSHSAAARILPRTGTQRRAVLELLMRSPGGLTDEEIGVRLHMNPSSVRPRRGELVKDGWVADSGQRTYTDSGAAAILWVYRAVEE